MAKLTEMKYDERTGNFYEVPARRQFQPGLIIRHKSIIGFSIAVLVVASIVLIILANRPPKSGPLTPQDYRYIAGDYTYNTGEGNFLPAKITGARNGKFKVHILDGTEESVYTFILDNEGTVSSVLGIGKAMYDADSESIFITFGKHSFMK